MEAVMSAPNALGFKQQSQRSDPWTGARKGESGESTPTRNQNSSCNSSGAGSVPPRPIEMKLLKSSCSRAVQRSCNWFAALSSELGRVISCAPKSRVGAVMLMVPVAKIVLLELNKKSESSLTFPAVPTVALALIKLLFTTIKLRMINRDVSARPAGSMAPGRSCDRTIYQVKKLPGRRNCNITTVNAS